MLSPGVASTRVTSLQINRGAEQVAMCELMKPYQAASQFLIGCCLQKGPPKRTFKLLHGIDPAPASAPVSTDSAPGRQGHGLNNVDTHHVPSVEWDSNGWLQECPPDAI